VWIVDDTTQDLLADIFVVPMALWGLREPDATRDAGDEDLGTTATTVPRVGGGGPQALRSANHNTAGDGGAGGRVRPSRHGSSE
jgi:hypothetical protein